MAHMKHSCLVQLPLRLNCVIYIFSFNLWMVLFVLFMQERCDTAMTIHRRYRSVYIPGVSNFSPQICFWWLRGSNFRPLEDSGTYIVYLPPSQRSQWKVQTTPPKTNSKRPRKMMGLEDDPSLPFEMVPF